jgi:hypothetical protein
MTTASSSVSLFVCVCVCVYVGGESADAGELYSDIRDADAVGHPRDNGQEVQLRSLYVPLASFEYCVC